LAVLHRRGQVDPPQLGVGRGATGPLDGVDHPGACAEVLHPWAEDGPGDVDDDLGTGPGRPGHAG
jgi:hypothetical protein